MQVSHPLGDRPNARPGAVTAPDGRTYSVDSDGTVDVPADVAAALREAWADRYEWYEPPAAEADEPAVAEPPLDPGAHTVAELRDALADGEFTAAELEALASAEQAGEHRTTAIEAIEQTTPSDTEA